MRRKTVIDLQKMKASNEKIAMITAYDATMAKLVDAGGVDMVLVGDSVGMVVQGMDDTLSVTLDDGHHGRCVAEDKPGYLTVMFMSYQVSPSRPASAGRLVKKARPSRCRGRERSASAVERRLNPVVVTSASHRSPPPSRVARPGTVRCSGRAAIQDALAIQDAHLRLCRDGPAELAAEVTSALRIPTIGIGAGWAVMARSSSAMIS